MTVHVCPERDIECGMYSANWCATCPLRKPGMTSDKPEPVRLPNGSVENFIVRIDGRLFRCPSCMCNVFHKPDTCRPDTYKCNACGSVFESE